MPQLTAEQARLNNAFCNAIVAVQDNYTYDALEQANMVWALAQAKSVESLNEMLESFDIKGYDLDTPNVGCARRDRELNKAA